MTTSVKSFKEGDKVRYIPPQANKNMLHSSCEDGIVSSVNDTFVFVKFFIKGVLDITPKACSPSDLVKINRIDDDPFGSNDGGVNYIIDQISDDLVYGEVNLEDSIQYLERIQRRIQIMIENINEEINDINDINDDD